MRMGRDGATAAELVNSADEEELVSIFWRYGEERRSRAVARAIVRQRPLASTDELSRLVERVVPETEEPEDPPRHPCLSGVADRGQRRARPARAIPRAGRAIVAAGWADGGDLVPLAGRPHRQTQFCRASRARCTCPPDFPECRCDPENAGSSADPESDPAHRRRDSRATRDLARPVCGSSNGDEGS